MRRVKKWCIVFVIVSISQLSFNRLYVDGGEIQRIPRAQIQVHPPMAPIQRDPNSNSQVSSNKNQGKVEGKREDECLRACDEQLMKTSTPDEQNTPTPSRIQRDVCRRMCVVEQLRNTSTPDVIDECLKACPTLPFTSSSMFGINECLSACVDKQWMKTSTPDEQNTPTPLLIQPTTPDEQNIPTSLQGQPTISPTEAAAFVLFLLKAMADNIASSQAQSTTPPISVQPTPTPYTYREPEYWITKSCTGDARLNHTQCANRCNSPRMPDFEACHAECDWKKQRDLKKCKQ